MSTVEPIENGMHAVVLGIGNCLLSDEGIGIHVVKYLERFAPNLPQVLFVDGGTLSFSLAPIVETASHLIVIDAAQLHATAGTMRCFEAEAMDNFLRTQARSVHEIGLRDLLDMVRLSACAPTHQALFAIQAVELGWGEFPTPILHDQIPDIAQQVLNLLQQWEFPLV